jgi:hypothetical protein
MTKFEYGKIAVRELLNNIHPVGCIFPAAATTDNTPWISSIIDTLGFESATLVLITGSLADADATFAVSVEHGNQSNLSDTSVPAATDLVGTIALASFDFSCDNKTRKLGYIGGNRYVRFTVTPSNNSGNAFLAGVVILGNPHILPTINPPA